MKIAVIGLGLIGGSICKALKIGTSHTVFGLDTNTDTLIKAKEQSAIDGAIDLADLKEADLVFVCLHPEATIDFVTSHVKKFKKGSILCDVCGIKSRPVDMLDQLLREEDINYLGTHPMAGREFSGFDYADAGIFKGASFIITPTELTPSETLDTVKNLANKMGFGKIVTTTADQHDRNIAFTSQLAHLVSNAYVKSPSLKNEQGFSAGSFQDLTRVARLNEDLWTSLFIMNKEPLLFELNGILNNLNDYKRALENEDVETMRKLLAEGRKLKEEADCL